MGVSRLKDAFKVIFSTAPVGDPADSAAQGMAEAIVQEITDPVGGSVVSVNGRTGAVILAKSDVGLANVDNTSDADKPISSATSTALSGKEPTIASKGTAFNKNFGVSAGEVCQGNDSRLSDARTPLAHTQAISTITDLQLALNGKQDVLGFTPIDSATKGQVNGIAELDSTGKVPASQLPSFVDDVVEYTDFASFPVTGETGKIYVTKDNNKVYRWGGSSYIEISPSPGSTDAVPEGAVNKYFTTVRASAAAPVQSVSGRTGAVILAKSDVGLANVDNTSDADKPISSATSTALSGKEPLISKSTGILSWTGTAWAWLTDVSSYVSSLAWSKLTGVPTSFAPSAHKTSHASGGNDALAAADIGAVSTSNFKVKEISADADTINVSGFYHCNAHIPTEDGETDKAVIHHQYNDANSGWATQIAQSWRNARIWIRNRENSTMENWVELVRTDDPRLSGQAPIGTVIMWAGVVAPPNGYAFCNGQAISRAAYPALFAAIGTAYGVGDGSTTFNLPDFKGASPAGSGISKGYAHTETIAHGVKHDDQIQGHWHDFKVNVAAGGAGGAGGYIELSADATNTLPPAIKSNVKSPIPDGVNGIVRTGNSTHGKLVGIHFIIRYA